MWAMSVSMMVVIIIGSLCCLAKCNANMLNRRKRRKVRAAERRKSLKKKKQEEAAEAALKMENEKDKAEKAKEPIKAISKSNPQPHRVPKPKPKSRKDFIIEIIDSALGGDNSDIVNGHDDLKYSSSDSIDEVFSYNQRQRRSSDASVALSLIFDTEADKPVFRMV